MHPIIKTITEMREYPMWMNTTTGSSCKEDVRNNHMSSTDQISYNCVLNSDLGGFGVDIDRACLYRDEFALLDESGSLIECEYETATNPNTVLQDARFQSKAWLFAENNKSAYYGLITEGDGVTNEIKTDSIDFEDGIFDLAYITNPMDEEENIWNISHANTFHINYTTYPLTDNSFPLGTSPQTYATFERKGNVGRLINKIPTDVTVSGLTSQTDYLFDTTSDDLTYYTVSELLQFFLASMNLYCYYTGKTFTFVRSFLASTGTPITIDTDDIIEWQTQTEEYVSIDTESVLQTTLNYVPNAIDPYYNAYAALDNKRATCKISRLFASPDYGITINSVLSISSANWRVEKLNVYEAYYDVTLTKYITDQT